MDVLRRPNNFQEKRRNNWTAMEPHGRLAGPVERVAGLESELVLVLASLLAAFGSLLALPSAVAQRQTWGTSVAVI